MELEHEANHCDFLVASHTILLPCMLDSAPSPYRYSDLQFLKLTSFASQIVIFGGPANFPHCEKNNLMIRICHSLHLTKTSSAGATSNLIVARKCTSGKNN